MNTLGEVEKWQYSLNTTLGWIDMNVSSEEIQYLNLSSSTFYRAEIKSGNCPSDFSSAARILINPKPYLNFTAADVCVGEKSTFTNNSTVSSGFIASYAWDLGDGNSASIKNIQYSYSQSGQYLVKLFATTNRSCIDSTFSFINVSPLPLVNFSFSNPCENSATQLSSLGSISSGNISQYFWDMNNGTTLTGSSFQYTYSTPGIYSVKHVLISNKNCKDSLFLPLTVYPRAKVIFNADDKCIGQAISFNNLTEFEGGKISYNWLLGNGNSSSLVNPIVNYTASGTYSVTLYALTQNNCSDNFVKSVQIFPGPLADFRFKDICLKYPAILENASTITSGLLSYEWAFGDGGFSSLQFPEHYYENSGSFGITLKVSSEANCSTSVTKTIKVNPTPNVNFVFNEVCDKDSIKFNNQSSILNGALLNRWYFGNGEISDLTNPSYLYQNSGIYNVKLIATSAQQCVDSLTKSVSIYPLPIPDFAAETVCLGNTSSFKNFSTITSGIIVNYSWNFTDGSNSIDFNPFKLYSEARPYKVVLAVNSDKGCKRDTAKTILVNPLPKADFETQNVCVNSLAFFTNKSTIANEPLSYVWNFNDSSAASDLPDPSHTFLKTGLYPITLVAATNFGCKDTISKTIEIYAPPQIAATSKDTIVSKGYSSILMAEGGNRYIWEPAEFLSNSTSATPEARPLSPTIFTVTGFDANGCKNFASVMLNVSDDYKLMVSNVLTPDGNGSNDTWYVENIETFPHSTVYVYDRQGTEIFKKTGYQNDWEGTSGYDILPDGTYYYFISIDSTTQIYKGAITILRNRR